MPLWRPVPSLLSTHDCRERERETGCRGDGAAASESGGEASGSGTGGAQPGERSTQMVTWLGEHQPCAKPQLWCSRRQKLRQSQQLPQAAGPRSTTAWAHCLKVSINYCAWVEGRHDGRSAGMQALALAPRQPSGRELVKSKTAFASRITPGVARLLPGPWPDPCTSRARPAGSTLPALPCPSMPIHTTSPGHL